MNQSANTPSQSATWCVRFINGPLRGRTIALKHGTNVVGSGTDCDILLQGDVQPRHLVFTVGDIAVSVQKLGTATAKLNGEELPMQRRSTVRGDIISVNSIDFEVDKVKAEGNALGVLAEIRNESVDDEPTSADAAPPPPPSTPWKFTIPLRYGFAMGGVIALATISAVIGLNTYDSGRTWSVVTPTVDIESLHRIVAEYPEVKVIDHADGKVGVRGFVESRARRSALTEALRRFGAGISINVHAADEIVEQAHRYLNDPDISVNYAGQGRLVVSGTTTNDAIHDKVARLGADLRSVIAIVDDVESGRRSKTKSVIKKNSSELAEWQNSLPSQMVGLTEFTNGMRHIQLSNGRRYYEGATLKSGDELVNIEADHLVVTNTRKKTRPDGMPPAEPTK